MKVLWITNVPLPAACARIGISTPVVGGWLFAGAQALCEASTVQLGLACLYDGDDLVSFEDAGCQYYLVPRSKTKGYDVALEQKWRDVHNEFMPDIVHLHGTEYSHGLAYLRGVENANVIVSVQGLVSVYSKYYFGGIDALTVLKYVTLRDILRFDSLFQQRRNMRLRGQYELECLKRVRNVLGRTRWDEAHVRAINSEAVYHHCGETLRKQFYVNRWRGWRGEFPVIFLSQAHYPIKGLHKVLEALHLIRKDLPNVRLQIAGNDFFSISRLKLPGYGAYIRQLLSEYCLADCVEFLGVLTEEQMVDAYCRASLFLCPSIIENSPNSIGEAQLLGVPCVSANVGGVMDMINDGITGMLYRFDEPEMLAYAVVKVLSDRKLSESLSESGRVAANARHNPLTNVNELIDIYGRVAGANDAN